VSESDKVFAGSIPEIYDRYLVPLIFEAFATDLAARVAALSPGAVLETAAGSGVVTRALAARLGPDARYVVTDLNQPMLDHAAGRQRPDHRITWRRADALDLPFEDASFDAVCCQFGAMFFPDRIAGYREARRVLRPGGSFLFSVWDRLEANEFAQVVTDAAATVFPDDPPRFLARIPHGYHDVGLIRDEVTKAGFSRISLSTLEETSRAPPRRATRLSPTARERRCAARSRRGTRTFWTSSRVGQPRRSPAAMATAPWLAGSRDMSSWRWPSVWANCGRSFPAQARLPAEFAARSAERPAILRGRTGRRRKPDPGSRPRVPD
jgi:ubiquinone/menaquinone biosynthesis C-methylase UbiE